MELDLLLFTADLALAKRVFSLGITGFILDWEYRGKSDRQRTADTEINRDGPEDIERISHLKESRRFCRVNGLGEWTPREIDLAVTAGATHVLLPMVETPRQVETFLRLLDGRALPGIMVETVEACTHASELATLPIELVYVGLNDLAISRGSRSIFAPFADGLALELRECFAHIPFGVGGLTVVDGGTPIPCRALMAELARLRCDLTFLRRSFRRDIVGRSLDREIPRIYEEWQRLRQRSKDEIEREHQDFVATHLPNERVS